MPGVGERTCPVVRGTNVPNIRILIAWISLQTAFPRSMLPNLCNIENRSLTKGDKTLDCQA